MKQVFLAVLAIIAIDSAVNAQLKVGVRAGGNLSNQRISVNEGTIYAGNSIKGFHAGFMAEANLGGNWYLQPQILFTRKGASHLSSTGEAATEVNMDYVDLPVNLLYKIDLGFGRLFGGAGAALSYGIGGREKQGGLSSSLYNGGKWRREDISLVFTGGIEFDNGFFASINSQKGLRDLYVPGSASIKNKSMSVSIGYMLDWKK